jgi:hypothetical protein
VNVWIGWTAEVRVPLAQPEPWDAEPALLDPAPPPYAWLPPALAATDAVDDREAAEAVVSLPPLPPLALDDRGFFDGDTLRLELTLVDRATGAPLWVKRVEKGVDPRDAKAVRALLDGALDDPKGWAPARG